jgi:hypothetical protein
MAELTYTRVGDYLLPDLTIGEEPQPTYGKYGMLRKRYMKEHRKGAYTQLLLFGNLNQYLAKFDETVRISVSRLVKEMVKQQGVDEALKAKDQMAWVGAMNMIKAQAEEIVLAEYVYL